MPRSVLIHQRKQRIDSLLLLRIHFINGDGAEARRARDEQCGVTFDAAVSSGHDAFELVKSGERPLNLPSLFVSAQ
ncbi:MAG: hypothetical protein ACJ8G3_02610 [Burkholderiaceae bacterium]